MAINNHLYSILKRQVEKGNVTEDAIKVQEYKDKIKTDKIKKK